MLKYKVKSLQKEMNKIINSKKTGVFFVEVQAGEYIVKAAGDNLVFKGDKEGYNSFIQKFGDGSVFIIDDIPRK